MESAFRPQSAEDIENRIEELRKSYAPEWKFDRKNPDAGSVIAQIFARQIEENKKNYLIHSFTKDIKGLNTSAIEKKKLKT